MEKLKLVSCNWYHQTNNGDRHVINYESTDNGTIMNTNMPVDISTLRLLSSSKTKEFDVMSWFAIKVPGHGNFVFYGKNTVNAIINSIPVNRLKDILSIERSALSDMSRSDFFNYVGQFQGIWSANYGIHGLELFSSRIVIENGSPKVCFTKITGDPNVPAGRISVKTEKVPVVGSKTSTKGFMQIRCDISNPSGFSWEDIEVEFPSHNSITYLFHHQCDLNSINQRCTLTRLQTANVRESFSRQDTLE